MRRAALALAALAALLSAPPAAAQVARSQPLTAPAEVRGYWTEERMEAAIPAELRLSPSADRPSLGHAPPSERAAVDQSAAGTSFPERVHGKVFFTVTGGSAPGDYVCSATVAASQGHTLAWTAGHCVNDAEFGGGFAENWTFVPAYLDGEEPFGSWPASRLFTTEGWRDDANLRVDLGAARLARDAQGRGIEDVVGARGIAFNRDRRQAYVAFGYPAQPTLLHPEFDGGNLYACRSPLTGTDSPPGSGPETLEIECDMSGGASGGSWVIQGGLIASVTSYGVSLDLLHLYGPYHGAVAERLYESADPRARTCARRVVTNLGGPGSDAFTGTRGNEALRTAGAADRVRGGAGADRACGGAGADRLAGQGGADVLRGGTGADELVGGPGRDRCDGGPGRDRARGCELRVRIP
jgi:hypothetical protein